MKLEKIKCEITGETIGYKLGNHTIEKNYCLGGGYFWVLDMNEEKQEVFITYKDAKERLIELAR